jgi:antitoxin (DNA-binding transcriptional repressor) of toxin-antitoxin stability system
LLCFDHCGILAMDSQNSREDVEWPRIPLRKPKTSSPLHQAEEGEEVAITRHGKVAAHLRSALERPHRQPSHELVAKTVERARSRPVRGENAVDIIRQMRDGEWD